MSPCLKNLSQYNLPFRNYGSHPESSAGQEVYRKTPRTVKTRSMSKITHNFSKGFEEKEKASYNFGQ